MRRKYNCGNPGNQHKPQPRMPRKRKSKFWGMPKDRQEPLIVRVALLLLLLNIFVWVGLRGTDILLVSMGSGLLALAGWIAAHRGRRKVRRLGGRGSSETMALMAYWGNLIIFLLVLFVFSYAVAMGILRGELI